jgi:hypothetical protein
MAPKGASSLPRQGAPKAVLINDLDDASLVPNITRGGSGGTRIRIPTGPGPSGNRPDRARRQPRSHRFVRIQEPPPDRGTLERVAVAVALDRGARLDGGGITLGRGGAVQAATPVQVPRCGNRRPSRRRGGTGAGGARRESAPARRRERRLPVHSIVRLGGPKQASFA